ncbi:hypothetical [Yersinia pestis KIM10+]|uniref:Uncharacterized protein n=1 Tax=Yersinia pestis TaxID=632 RepID=Q8CLA6_YERPE|nr:hypothetical [Yersinia pestis KIM10+]
MIVINRKKRFALYVAAEPMLLNLGDPDALESHCCCQSFFIIEPETDPIVQILGWPVFALCSEPRDIDLYVISRKKRRPTPATKTD